MLGPVNNIPLCDFLGRYVASFTPKWKKLQLRTRLIGIRRFNEWLTVCGYKISDLNWEKLLLFHEFLAAQGISRNACKRGVQDAKHAIRWGIENGELPQKHTDIYTFQYPRNKWNQDIPQFCRDYLAEFESTRPGAYRSHLNTHRVFHTFLIEKKFTYRRLRSEHMAAFIKYLSIKGFSLHTKVCMSRHVIQFLKRLYKNKKISRHPDEIFPPHIIPKDKINLPRPLEPELDARMQELLSKTDDIYYKAILLLRRAGLRIAELRKLEFNCIQQDHKGRASLIVPPVKLSRERRVPLDQDTVELIKLLQKMSLKNWIKKSEPKFLVIGEQGVPPRYERYSGAMAELCVKLRVKKWINLHALRHTYATALLNAGLSITSLKEILGHKAINMSLVYAKVSNEKIHSEYSEALTRMSQLHIPKLLEPKKTGLGDAFVDINSAIAKSLDRCSDEKQKRQLNSLKNRMAKLKMELLKVL